MARHGTPGLPAQEWAGTERQGPRWVDSRKVFCAIVYVLRTGIQWKALPREFGSASSIHAYFQKWTKAGFFLRLWKKGLAEYDEMEGIAWRWQSIDGSQGRAPLATEAVDPNPTDRRKKGNKAARAGRWAWSPVVDSRDRGQPA
jgi:transposase